MKLILEVSRDGGKTWLVVPGSWTGMELTPGKLIEGKYSRHLYRYMPHDPMLYAMVDEDSK